MKEHPGYYAGWLLIAMMIAVLVGAVIGQFLCTFGVIGKQ